MDANVALDYLTRGLASLQAQAPAWDRRQDYFEGRQDLPFAPEGVNDEYKALQAMSLANFIGLAMAAPVQRMQADGFRTGRDKAADIVAWDEIWQPNKLDSRQSIVFQQMFIHGRGIMSVSVNPLLPKSPKIRPESSRRVWIEPNPDDPFEQLFAVKELVTPTGAARLAYVYSDNEWVKFSLGANDKAWVQVEAGAHNMQQVPFIPFDFNVNAEGIGRAAITQLMPQQDAINTIRFNALLAMQFSAFRQRVFTGFDPVVRDKQGNPLIKLDSEGKPVLDANGLPQPVLNTPGRIGVDRALVFPGADTKVFDLAESNLNNYIVVLQEFLTAFFGTAQVPPQYAMNKMANTAGDAMAGAEATFQSLIGDLQRAAGESLESVMNLANRARGDAFDDVAAEVIWADSEIRSFAQIVDAIGKLIASGMAREDAWMMLPSATPPKVALWVENSNADIEAQDSTINALAEKIGG